MRSTRSTSTPKVIFTTILRLGGLNSSLSRKAKMWKSNWLYRWLFKITNFGNIFSATSKHPNHRSICLHCAWEHPRLWEWSKLWSWPGPKIDWNSNYETFRIGQNFSTLSSTKSLAALFPPLEVLGLPTRRGTSSASTPLSTTTRGSWRRWHRPCITASVGRHHWFKNLFIYPFVDCLQPLSAHEKTMQKFRDILRCPWILNREQLNKVERECIP